MRLHLLSRRSIRPHPSPAHLVPRRPGAETTTAAASDSFHRHDYSSPRRSFFCSRDCGHLLGERFEPLGDAFQVSLVDVHAEDLESEPAIPKLLLYERAGNVSGQNSEELRPRWRQTDRNDI